LPNAPEPQPPGTVRGTLTTSSYDAQNGDLEKNFAEALEHIQAQPLYNRYFRWYLMTEQMIRSIAMLSARNQLAAVVKSVKLGNVMAEVVVNIAGTEVVAVITRGSAEALKLQPGDHVKAVIKSTEVLIDKS
jgi:molybdopterin-binding protein